MLSKLTCVVLAMGFCVVFCGCGEVPRGDSELLAVDFGEGAVLNYKFVSERELDIDLDPSGKLTKGDKGSVSKMRERFEMAVRYEAVEVDPYGLTKVRVTIESVETERESSSKGRSVGKDAAMILAGRSYELKVSAGGRIEDKSELRELIMEVGRASFGKKKDSRVKDMDMSGDVIAGLWFMWDSLSSLSDPWDGVKVGSEWGSQLNVPLPMVLMAGRDVVYKVSGFRAGPFGREAVIESNYSFSAARQFDWPLPYEGSFQMRGMFGFLRGYKVLGLAGGGEQVFDIDRGVLLSDEQDYDINLSAVMFSLGGSTPRPSIKVHQKMSMQLIED